MRYPIKPKKSLGQHFLIDKNIARKITDSLVNTNALPVIEIGPGTGVLTEFLLEKPTQLTLIEIDKEAVEVLKTRFNEVELNLIHADFIKLNLIEHPIFPACIIGNLPYNISSQIFFKIIENHDLIPEVVCMIQKEVAQRIAAPPGSKTYGILSVLLQAWYKIEYLFTVNETVFNPPPKVKSAVIRLTRNNTTDLGCNQAMFTKVVKAAFNQRRKTVRNALKLLDCDTSGVPTALLDSRAEKLDVKQFSNITKIIFG